MAQLVERDLAKVEAAGSSPVSRSDNTERTSVWMSFLCYICAEVLEHRNFGFGVTKTGR